MNTQILPLENGDRLTREEFHRRYEAMPENVKAMLKDDLQKVLADLQNGLKSKKYKDFAKQLSK